MSRAEVTAFTAHLRTLRTSPPTMGKQLRDDEEITDEDRKEAGATKAKKAPAKADPNKILAELIARAENAKKNAT